LYNSFIKKNTSAPHAAAGLYASEASLIITSVTFEISTFYLISTEILLDVSRFSISSILSKISPSASASCLSNDASNCFSLILNSLDCLINSSF
jgi:hypothetical protein